MQAEGLHAGVFPCQADRFPTRRGGVFLSGRRGPSPLAVRRPPELPLDLPLVADAPCRGALAPAEVPEGRLRDERDQHECRLTAPAQRPAPADYSLPNGG